MNKQEFLLRIKDGLSGLPCEDVEERLAFFDEMIADKIEDGLSEEEAISSIGGVDEVVSQILDETPLSKIIKQKIAKKRCFKAWEIVLLAIGSPLWVSLLVTAVAVVFSLYVSVWAIIISLWSVFVSLAVSSIGCLFGSVVFVCTGYFQTAIATLAASLVCAGLTIFAFFGCKATTKCVLLLTKKMVLGLKKRLTKKEEA